MTSTNPHNAHASLALRQCCAMLTLLLGILASPAAQSCQLEYSDRLISIIAGWGYHQEKRVGSYASIAECEAARLDAVRRSGDPSLANNLSCVECSSAEAPTIPAGGTGVDPGEEPLVLYPQPVPVNEMPQSPDNFDKENKKLISSLKRGASGVVATPTTGTSLSGFALKPGISTPASSTSALVRAEQTAIEQSPAEWLRKEHELIRAGMQDGKPWQQAALRAIKTMTVPNPAARPKALEDLRPGDVLLVEPDDSGIATAIKYSEPVYRALDYFVSGKVSEPDLKTGKVTHVLTFIRRDYGRSFFLDHTKEGSRVIDETELVRRYAGRAIYIAKPQTKVDGRALWEAAKEAALKPESDYGLLGSSVVCSERAALAVAKATNLPLQRQHHGLGIWWPIDVTPTDFFDEKHIGKFFLVNTIPFIIQPEVPTSTR